MELINLVFVSIWDIIFLYSDGFKAGFMWFLGFYCIFGGVFLLFIWVFILVGWFFGFCSVENIIVLFFFIACLVLLSEC